MDSDCLQQEGVTLLPLAMYDILSRLGKDGVKMVCQNSGLFNVLEGHVHKLLISQYSKNEIIEVMKMNLILS